MSDLKVQHNDKGASEHFPFREGQKIIYEGEEGEVIRVHPFPIVRTENRVVCGNVRAIYSSHHFQKNLK